MEQPVISGFDSFVLGVVEGITEFLPVSSTGHLVVTSELLGLRGHVNRTADQIAAIQAFEIVIQAGAILAVLLLYKKPVLEMIQGILGRNPDGRKLFLNICAATFPVLAVGYLAKDLISTYLQFTGPVLIAMVVGGVFMIVFEKFFVKGDHADTHSPTRLHDMSLKQAAFVGGLQCIALFPGTSRSMVTIMGGMLTGLKRPMAAEFSFLVGLPVLLAATAYKTLKEGPLLLEHVGVSSLVIGLLTSTVFAFFAVKWLVAFLNKRGLAFFGWYRLLAAAVIYFVVGL